MAVPVDMRVACKEKEKVQKYRDLDREIQKLWKVRAEVIPAVVGALGTIPRSLENHLEEIGCGV